MVKNFLVALIVAAGLAAGSATAQTGPNTLGKIKAAKAINIAYSADSLPFSFAGPNNEPAGYSIDLCKRVIAQIGRAVGGGFAGNQLAQRSQTFVWRIGVRYDDGTIATVQQTSAPGLSIGDRVQVTNTGIELLRG